MRRARLVSRDGTSLLEVLIALSVVGMLLGLILPAVSQVRAAAARIGCANNLRQLGLAIHGHHEA